MNFGAYLKAARKKRGMRLSDVAGKVGLSGPYVSELERGAKPPPNDTRVKSLSNAVGCDYEFLKNLADAGRGYVKIRIGGVDNEPDKAALMLSKVWCSLNSGEIREIFGICVSKLMKEDSPTL